MIPFVGPSYHLDTRAADVQRTVNMYLVVNEVAGGKTPSHLKSVPGLTVFSADAAAPSAMGWCDPVQERDHATVEQDNAGTLPEEANGGNPLYGGIVGGGGTLTTAVFELASWEPIIPDDDPPLVEYLDSPPNAATCKLEWFLHRDEEFGFITAISGGTAKISATVDGVPCPGFLQATCTPTFFEGNWNGYAVLEWLWVAS